MNRDLIHLNSSCRIEVLHYSDTDTDFSDDEVAQTHRELMSVEHIVLQNEIVQCNMSKSISNIRGTFDFLLLPTMNWKTKIRPGDWLVIYLSTDGDERPRMLGNVDRISKMINVDQKGKKTTRYKVSGSNFGKVFDKYNIYWNPFMPGTIGANYFIQDKKLRFKGSPTDIVNDLLEVFLGNETDAGKKYPELLQWFIPNKLTTFFERSTDEARSNEGLKFFDILNKDLDPASGYKVWSNINSLSGNLWSLMKRSSNSMINELFVELKKTSDNKYSPTLVMRMIPFASSKYNFFAELNNSVPTVFKDLPTVNISTNEILGEDLGENDHTRFNYFILWSQAQQIDGRPLTDALALSGEPRFPKLIKGSMRRHGFLAKIDTTDFAFLSSTDSKTSDGKSINDLQLLRAWNDLMVHWYEEDYKYETGTMTVLGNPDIELGKRLVVKDTANVDPDRAYYIEGYSDTWQYPGTWLTSLQLTRGQDAKTEQPLLDAESERTINSGTSSILNGFKKKNRKGK